MPPEDRPTPHPSRRTAAAKRVFDVVASTLGVILFLPLMIIIAIAIKLDSPGPIFFRQERVGWNGQPFRVFKFRSMADGAGRVGTALTVRADSRITRVGHFLRKHKLDELPQLLNVLAGEMSMVGPRPEVPEFMKFYTAGQRTIILSMRPGITDYAAILFHDESSLLDQDAGPIEIYRCEIMPIKFAHYERYSREISVRTDLGILAATLLLLMTGRVPRSFGSAHQRPDVSLATASKSVTPSS
jgi:lipopolysaccharide/colanic/teichoic acid biosynthesis glycosyltransferase